MLEVKYGILHCTATREGREVSRVELSMMHHGPAKNKNGTFTYRGKVYPNLNSLPDEKIGNAHIRHIALAYPGRGWSKWGYEKFQHLDGSWEVLVENDNNKFVDPREMTNGALGINGISRHFSYVGGLSKSGAVKDTRTPEQIAAQIELVFKIIEIHPNIEWAGHNQFAVKGCPSFDVPKWLRSIGVPEKNICKKPLMIRL